MEKICYSHSRMCLIHEYSWVFISQFIFLVGWIHEWPRFSCYDLGQVWLLNVIELRKMKILAHVIFKSNLIEESHPGCLLGRENAWIHIHIHEFWYSWMALGWMVNGTFLIQLVNVQMNEWFHECWNSWIFLTYSSSYSENRGIHVHALIWMLENQCWCEGLFELLESIFTWFCPIKFYVLFG